jgi:hypothetical protein
MNLKNPYRGAKGMKAQMVPQTLARAIDSCRNKKLDWLQQGSFPEGEGSVRLTSLFNFLLFRGENCV